MLKPTFRRYCLTTLLAMACAGPAFPPSPPMPAATPVEGPEQRPPA